MLNFDLENSFIAGSYRSGKTMNIPTGFTRDQKIEFIKALDNSSAVDCLCVMEFLLSSANERRLLDSTSEQVEEYTEILLKNFALGFYDAELARLNLATSLARLKLGLTLAAIRN